VVETPLRSGVPWYVVQSAGPGLPLAEAAGELAGAAALPVKLAGAEVTTAVAVTFGALELVQAETPHSAAAIAAAIAGLAVARGILPLSTDERR
jgi:hypothetical protein